MSFRQIGELCRDVIAEAELAARGQNVGHEQESGPSGMKPAVTATQGGYRSRGPSEADGTKLVLIKTDIGMPSVQKRRPTRKGYAIPPLGRPMLVWSNDHAVSPTSSA